MANDDTTFRVSKSTWARVNARKQEPGETPEDVIIRLLDKTEHPLFDDPDDE